MAAEKKKAETEQPTVWELSLDDPLAPATIDYFASQCDRAGRPKDAQQQRTYAGDLRRWQMTVNGETGKSETADGTTTEDGHDSPAGDDTTPED